MTERRVNCAVCDSSDKQLLTSTRGNRGLDYIAERHDVTICRSCGLVHLDPQQGEEDYVRYYRSADYKAIIAAPQAMLQRHAYRRIQSAFILDTLRRLWREWTRLSVVDVGCGPGILLKHLVDAGLDASGLETSPVAADYAESRFGLRIIRGSVFDNLLPSGTFDVVTSTAAIEHFTRPLDAVRAMSAALRPGGLLYVNTPDLLGMVLKKGEGHCFKFVHTYYFTEVSLTNLLERAGLEVVRSWTMPPQIESSVVFPGNYCSGELNIIAAKVHNAEPYSGPRRRETPDRIQSAYAAAQERDRLHFLAKEAAKYRPVRLANRVLGRVFPPKPVFSSFYLPDGNVDVRRFPPLLKRTAEARPTTAA